MASLRQMCGSVRMVHLGSPLPQQPTQHALYSKLLQNIQRVVNRLSNTGKPWLVERVPLIVQGNQPDYALNVPPGAKILSVTANADILDTGDTLRYEVPLVEIQDVYQNGAGWQWQSPYLEQLAFYRNSSGEIRVRAVPTVRSDSSITLEILYTLGDIASLAAPGMEMPLSEFSSMAELQTAYALLSQTRWSGDLAQDNLRKAEFERTLLFELAGWDKDFEAYTKQILQPKVIQISSGGF